MVCNVKWNGERMNIFGFIIYVIFEFEWNSGEFSGENVIGLVR